MNRLDSLRRMIRERRVGFAMDEVMQGTHHFVNDAGPPGEHPLIFRVTWGARHLGPWLNPFGSNFMQNFLEGTVTAGGLVEDAPCSGTLHLLYFTESKIRYTFDFKSGDGRPLRYVGEKVDIRPWNLHRTHTTCYGTITDLEADRAVSKSIVYFDLKSMPSFAASFRLA